MKENKQFLGRGWSFPLTFERGTPELGGTVCMVAAGIDIPSI